MLSDPGVVVTASDIVTADRFGEPESFAEALRAAVEDRGIGLTRVHGRLRAAGISISLATLSYWQSGSRRPERPESLVALSALEQILEVPRGSLRGLLGPPRPRGRSFGKSVDVAEMSTWWTDREAVDDALAQVDTRWDNVLTRLSQHDLVRVGRDRDEVSCRYRQVLRAEEDGPDRWVHISQLDERERPLPEIHPYRHCRLGRVVRRPDLGLLVAELLFDRPLARGETIITEYELANHAPGPLITNYERKSRLPVRELALEVSFDSAALPLRCEQFTRLDGAYEVRGVELDVSGSVHGVTLNFGPGCYGFRWHWS